MTKVLTGATNTFQTKRGVNGIMGYVYIVRSDVFYKIGKTSQAPFKRLCGLQTGSPHELELVCYIEHPDYPELERALHKAFRANRVLGEWFRLEPEHLERIKKMADWVRPLTKEEQREKSDIEFEAWLERERTIVRNVRAHLSAKTSQKVTYQGKPITFMV
jgi:hypothetical protein